jgi:hypothetical protein
LLAPVVKDGFSRYRRQFLVRLPIPAARRHQCSEIVRAAETGEHGTSDALCCRLFGLTERQLRTMRGFLDRARQVHGRHTTGALS